MPEIRVDVIGQPQFDPREWLRREALWASLMMPYDEQMKTWHNGTAVQQHNGNVSRAALPEDSEPDTVERQTISLSDVENESIAFFNQGKNIGGIVSSMALFRSAMYEQPRSDDEPITDSVLETQTKCVDIALGATMIRSIKVPGNDQNVYAECERLALLNEGLDNTSFVARHRWLRAAKMMSALAIDEVANWQLMAQQNSAGSLPELIIPNGGHPRSGGSRVDRLEPVFTQLIASPLYLALGNPQARVV